MGRKLFLGFAWLLFFGWSCLILLTVLKNLPPVGEYSDGVVLLFIVIVAALFAALIVRLTHLHHYFPVFVIVLLVLYPIVVPIAAIKLLGKPVDQSRAPQSQLNNQH